MIKEILQEGFILKNKGFYKHAIEVFYKALELDNHSSELLIEIADCYYQLNNEERALNYIEQILTKNPSHIDSLKFLKKIFIRKNAFAETLQVAKNIYLISKNPSDLAEIFKILNKQKKYNEIFEYSTEIETEEILHQQAYAKLFLNNLKEAEELINKALDLNSSHENQLLKAKILFKMNRLEESTELIKNMDTKDSDSDYLNFVGLIMQNNFELMQAIKYFKKAIKLDPKNDEYYYNCGSTYFKMDDIQNAKNYYNLAISINPDNQNYHFALANLYYSEKNYKRALEELKYDFFEANLLKAIILYDTGYLVLAQKELNKLELEDVNNELVKLYKEKIKEELML